MAKLNISELRSKIISNSKSNSKKSLEKVDKEVRGFADENSQALEYSEYDFKTGDHLQISGSSKNGYSKYYKPGNSSFIEYTTYYPSGYVQSTLTKYFGHLSTDFPKNVSYPVGKEFYFNEKGILLREIDYDKIFKYTVNDIIKLLKKRDATTERLSVERFYYNELSVVWELFFISSKDGYTKMIINGITGDVIEEKLHMQVYE